MYTDITKKLTKAYLWKHYRYSKVSLVNYLRFESAQKSSFDVFNLFLHKVINENKQLINDRKTINK